MSQSKHFFQILGYIGGNVRAARLRNELTQEKLGEAADVDLRFLQRVERGRNNLSIAILVSLADALGVSPGALLEPIDLPPPRPGRPPRAPVKPKAHGQRPRRR